MFSFFKRKKRRSFNLKVDIHSHLLPGIDDGASNLEESLKLIKKMEEIGYKKLIITPHTDLEVYPNTKKSILKSFNLLKDTLNKTDIKINIEVSSEYYLDEGFPLLIKEDQLIPISNKYILFETSYITKPSLLEDVIYEIKLKNYAPILAHPERYRYILDCKKEYKRLKDLGVLFQVNLNSFNGHYGREAKEKVLFLAKNGMIDFLGSDTHKLRHLLSLEETLRDFNLMEMIFSKNKILNDRLL